jgi:hypothetical protein
MFLYDALIADPPVDTFHFVKAGTVSEVESKAPAGTLGAEVLSASEAVPLHLGIRIFDRIFAHHGH